MFGLHLSVISVSDTLMVPGDFWHPYRFSQNATYTIPMASGELQKERKHSRLKPSLTFLLMTFGVVQTCQSYVHVVPTVDVLLFFLTVVRSRLILYYETLNGFLCSDKL